MTRRASPLIGLHPCGWSVIVAVAAVAGLASAQPAPTPAPAEPAPTAPISVEPPQEAAPPPEAVPVEPTPATAVPAVEAKKPEEPVAPVVPAKRPRYDVAVLQALDKITAETVRFEAAVGKPVRYKSLVFTVKACERSTDEETTPDAIAYLTIESQPKAAPGKPTPAPRQAFRGWMYASSPGLHALEHPVYDAWLITCRAAAPS
jgi:hypothetical protein